MQTSFNYQREGEPFRWQLVLKEDYQTVEVFCNGMSREYTLPLYGSVMESRQENEYVFLTNIAGTFVQFKFEEGGFLVGDVFDPDGEFQHAFGSWVFGEDEDEEEGVQVHSKEKPFQLLQVGYVSNSPWSVAHTVTLAHCGRMAHVFDLTWGQASGWATETLPTLQEVADKLGTDVLWVRRYDTVLDLPNWSHPQRAALTDDFVEELYTPLGLAWKARQE